VLGFGGRPVRSTVAITRRFFSITRLMSLTSSSLGISRYAGMRDTSSSITCPVSAGTAAVSRAARFRL